MKKEIDLLDELLKVYPGAVSQAFWRVFELRLFKKLDFIIPILDLGCGDGSFSSLLFKDKKQKISSGCDLSENKISKAKSLNLYENLRIADICKLPYENDVFNTVFSNCVLEHIPDEKSALREVSRVLRKNGLFIFTVPSEMFPSYLYFYKNLIDKGLKEKAENYVKELNEQLQHHHYHSPDEWNLLLKEMGLTMIKAAYYMPEKSEYIWNKLYSIDFKKNKMNYIMRFFFSQFMNLVVKIYLRKYYLLETDSTKKGGGVFIIARK